MSWPLTVREIVLDAQAQPLVDDVAGVHVQPVDHTPWWMCPLWTKGFNATIVSPASLEKKKKYRFSHPICKTEYGKVIHKDQSAIPRWPLKPSLPCLTASLRNHDTIITFYEPCGKIYACDSCAIHSVRADKCSLSGKHLTVKSAIPAAWDTMLTYITNGTPCHGVLNVDDPCGSL
ncbi:hypothetical protein A1Q2_05711 [Trichosporon asahii var. asahii CBS 8904]|uniref:Uncharacterized protein n=1 Tax=Trichosporon asahii var. asahii (strain CBS 8904) TaxID=1220162 RepID=K1VL43_TRIAC|nr:hypothetical protein A1Q2_05711 [Trichosporon asahii var. asahii CBS 8904]